MADYSFLRLKTDFSQAKSDMMVDSEYFFNWGICLHPLETYLQTTNSYTSIAFNERTVGPWPRLPYCLDLRGAFQPGRKRSGCANLTCAGMPRVLQWKTRCVPKPLRHNLRATSAGPPCASINAASGCSLSMAVLNTTVSRGVNIRLAASFCARQTLPPMHPTVERLYLAARALEKLSIPAKRPTSSVHPTPSPPRAGFFASRCFTAPRTHKKLAVVLTLT